MGKAAIILVVSYSLLLLVSGVRLSDISVQAYDNALDYYEGGSVRNIAIAGANMAANRVFLTPPLINGNPWWTGYSSIKFGGGEFTVTLDTTSSIDPDPFADKRVTLKSTATYADSTYTVTVIYGSSKFSKYALYAGAAAAAVYFETGDSIFGPTHAQGTLRVCGSPFFGGKVTTLNGVDSISYPGGPHHPTFNAGLDNGVSVLMNGTIAKIGQKAASGGAMFSGGGGDLYLKFRGDSVMYRRGTNPDTTAYLPDFSPNGAIALDRGNVHIEGQVTGRYTVASLDSTGGGAKGRVFVENDLTYTTDPRTNPTSTDMLGVCAWNDIEVRDNGATTFQLFGSFFSYKKGVTVQGYNARNPGILYTYGGWSVYDVYPTSNGVRLGAAGSKGYKCSINYDERYRNSAPPFFPNTNSYEILAWYE